MTTSKGEVYVFPVIGDWVRRQRGGKSHLVDSIVAGDVITNCGRRMRDEPNSRGRLVGEFDTKPCQICSGYRPD